MANKNFSFSTRAGNHWRDDLHKYKAVIEQRAIFYGGKAAKEAADLVLEAAKAECPVDTGHLRNSGRVLKAGKGTTKPGTAEGVGLATGSYYKNTGKKTAYVVSFNTMRVAEQDGKTPIDHDTDPKGKASSIRGSKSSARGFNYAIKIHEQGGKGGHGAKFLENAYREKRAELEALFKKANRDIWTRSYKLLSDEGDDE